MRDSTEFDLWADSYENEVETSDSNGEYPFAGYKKLMSAIYDEVMKKCPARALDIGIGTGALAAKLYKAGNDVTGIDFSAEMLKVSGERMPGARLIRHDFSEGLPACLNGEIFDFIISTYALHHITDKQKVRLIKLLLGHLAKDGKILIGDISFPDRESLEICKNSCGSDWDGEEHYSVFSDLCEFLGDECNLIYYSFSHCAGITEISRKI
ncbi:MAG: class I SAM-dependent methyltransferase [Oscillospiraceae bacterium]|jgi:putative AdoMet-dependent methyltransferase|nr:class I SAM-dependent methyltransferase [Oscillospiraceae bacterium]